MARVIKLKKSSIVLPGNNKPTDFDYGQTIIDILRTPPPGGYGIDDMRLGVKIIDKIQGMKAGSNGNGVQQTLTLEDAEWDYLNTKVQTNKWGTADKVILEFSDTVKEAETIQI